MTLFPSSQLVARGGFIVAVFRGGIWIGRRIHVFRMECAPVFRTVLSDSTHAFEGFPCVGREIYPYEAARLGGRTPHLTAGTLGQTVPARTGLAVVQELAISPPQHATQKHIIPAYGGYSVRMCPYLSSSVRAYVHQIVPQSQ